MVGVYRAEYKREGGGGEKLVCVCGVGAGSKIDRDRDRKQRKGMKAFQRFAKGISWVLS